LRSNEPAAANLAAGFSKKVLSMVIVALGGLLEGCPQPAQEGILFWIRIDLI